MERQQAEVNSGKQDHMVRYIIYAAAAYFGLQYLFKPRQAGAAVLTLSPAKGIIVADDNAVVVPPQSTIKTNNTASFPLRKGMKGQHVLALQLHLGIKADGIFGDMTEAVLMQRYRMSTVSELQYRQILQTKIVPTTPASSAQVVLKMGSVGADVYQLQKWLGFKDRNNAKRNEFIADSHFGRQTEFALLYKTGKRTISVPELRQRLEQPAYS